MKFSQDPTRPRIPGSVSFRGGTWNFIVRDPSGRQVRRAGFSTAEEAEGAGKAFWLVANAGRDRRPSSAYERARLAILAEDARRLVWPADDELTFVYAIGAGYAIKVGRSRDPRERLTQIRSRNAARRLIAPVSFDPLSAELLYTRAGGRGAEETLHRLLRNYYLTGEWFERHPSVLAVLDGLMDQAPPRVLKPWETEPRTLIEQEVG